MHAPLLLRLLITAMTPVFAVTASFHPAAIITSQTVLVTLPRPAPHGCKGGPHQVTV